MDAVESIFCVIFNFPASCLFFRIFLCLPCRLQKCKLKGYCFEALAVALSAESNHLKELDLSANVFMDTGLRDLCVGLKSHRCTLQTLRFGITHLEACPFFSFSFFKR